ncbi:TetR/AcrR family transcriptional regulator [Ruegeria lacuscaerulensis]|uniref:TetR/AcrR family transcriptional regulator n=1 Tax=Ruegeria lacuscaerulensis TaxID=55218 RepID=UPI002F267BB7
MNPQDIMTAFAQYGFRKTSMEDIARAVGLSRQSIYKKFGSKDACYAWALRAYTEALYQHVFALLDQAENAPMAVVETALISVVGDSVELAESRHGSELLEDALAVASAQPENWPSLYAQKLGAFILRHDLAATPERAQDLAHILITATRGALVVASSREAFARDIRRILRGVFGDP